MMFVIPDDVLGSSEIMQIVLVIAPGSEAKATQKIQANPNIFVQEWCPTFGVGFIMIPTTKQGQQKQVDRSPTKPILD